ncbi:MAG: WhiB family transcriptional regulator [Actinomycetota bacterium]
MTGRPTWPMNLAIAAETWRELGSCWGTFNVAFFPGQGETIDAAVRICRTCPVLEDCLDWAVANPRITPDGSVFAGTDSRTRREIRLGRKRRSDVLVTVRSGRKEKRALRSQWRYQMRRSDV